jgi:hypothetical protein
VCMSRVLKIKNYEIHRYYVSLLKYYLLAGVE